MCLSNLKYILLLLCLLLYSKTGQVCNAQQAETQLITGVIVDEKGDPLLGATVRIMGTKCGTASDIQGQFSIRCNQTQVGDKIIVAVNYIGMKQVQQKWQGIPLHIVLSPDTEVLGDLIVEARTNINDLDLRTKSGVVSHVDMKELQQKPMIDISMALQ